MHLFALKYKIILFCPTWGVIKTCSFMGKYGFQSKHIHYKNIIKISIEELHLVKYFLYTFFCMDKDDRVWIEI